MRSAQLQRVTEERARWRAFATRAAATFRFSTIYGKVHFSAVKWPFHHSKVGNKVQGVVMARVANARQRRQPFPERLPYPVAILCPMFPILQG